MNAESKPGECPSLDELWGLVHGEPAEERVHAHIGMCPKCQAERDHMVAERSGLRALAAARLATTLTHPVNTSRVMDLGKDSGALPARIGPYRVISRIATSGQADVYLGQHPTLPRQVVVKWSRKQGELADPARDRIAREGRILVELRHPNLAQVHDLGVEENRPYLAMELIRGPTLAQYRRDYRLEPRAIAALVAKMARACAACHRMGILHLDIKPDNIVMDESGEPWLIDFGIATIRNAWLEELAAPGEVAGTPSYMAPEQARGEASRLGPMTDVFALGGVLYFLLVGKAPIEGADTEERLARAQRCDWDRSAVLKSGQPRRLVKICLKALACDRAKRYPNADGLAAALERFARRPRKTTVGLAALAVGAALAFVLFRPVGDPPHPPLPEFQTLIRVHGQEGGPSATKQLQAAPLFDGDLVKIVCEVPSGLSILAFWRDSLGELHEIASTASKDSSGVATLYLPEGKVLPVVGAEGTELIVVCGRRGDAPQLSEVKSLFAEGRWPQLPPYIVCRFSRDKLKYEFVEATRGPGEPEPDELAGLSELMESARGRLREHFEFVQGVAFRHLEGGRAK